jgi:guanosine-3',5'-bis(diphosphate) 3'-pyrophosphohydrolase
MKHLGLQSVNNSRHFLLTHHAVNSLKNYYLNMNNEQSLVLMRAISFAADRHRFQTRKDNDGTPYINHPIKVALTLMNKGNEFDADLLIAAVLHDTIEDTETTANEIEAMFGTNVMKIVLEVTDDKSLPKDERKRLQIVHASGKSIAAQKLKLADKICNVYDIIHSPPGNWTVERKLAYLSWAEQVLEGLSGANQHLEKELRDLIVEGREALTTAVH